MKPNISRLGLLTLAALSTLSLMGCSTSQNRTVSVMLNNQAKENWYLWTGEAETPEGQGETLPGGFKNMMLGLRTRGEQEGGDEYFADQLKVHASNDGKAGYNYVLHPTMKYEEGKTIYVRWDGKDMSIGY